MKMMTGVKHETDYVYLQKRRLKGIDDLVGFIVFVLFADSMRSESFLWSGHRFYVGGHMFQTVVDCVPQDLQ